MNDLLTAGCAAVDITPPRGMELAGYPHYPRHNTGVHDPLLATCLYLESGEERLALLGMDILFFSKRHVDVLRRRLEEEIGLPPHCLMVCCSHSHSTPWAAGRLDLDALLAGAKQDEGYIGELLDKLTALAVSAYRTRFRAELAFATAHCGREQGIGGNRRDPDNGPSDPTAYVIAVRDEMQTVRGVFVNYALHPTLLHADNTLCSADYPGYIRAELRERFPHAVMVFGLGAAGDQSSRYFRTGQSFAEAERFGRAIGSAASRAVALGEFRGDVRLSSRHLPFLPGMRRLPDEEAARQRMVEAREAYRRLKEGGAPYLEVQNANVTMLGAEDIYGYTQLEKLGLSLELREDELPALLTLFRIGDVAVAGLPGEVFMGVAQALRKRSGHPAMVINTVTNGCLPGYLYTREEAAYGGYEIDTSLMDENAGEALVDAFLRLFSGGEEA